MSSLPPDLQRHVLEQVGAPVRTPAPRRPRVAKRPSGLMRVCSCRFEIFRPDGIYPDHCDGCGQPWPS